MKKLIALILLLISAQIQAKPAEAGIVLFINPQGADWQSGIESAVDLTVLGLSTAVIAGIFYAMSANPTAGWVGTAGALVFVLDASGTPSTNSIEEALSARYPFIDSKDALRALATAMNTKVPVQVEKSTLIHLSETEIRNALMRDALTDEEIDRVVADLK